MTRPPTARESSLRRELAELRAENAALRTELNSLRETVEILGDADAVRDVAAGLADARAGRVTSSTLDRRFGRVFDALYPWTDVADDPEDAVVALVDALRGWLAVELDAASTDRERDAAVVALERTRLPTDVATDAGFRVRADRVLRALATLAVVDVLEPPLGVVDGSAARAVTVALVYVRRWLDAELRGSVVERDRFVRDLVRTLPSREEDRP